MDDLVQSRTHQLLKLAPSLVVLYLQHRNDEEICQMVWHQMLNKVASNPDHIESSLLELIGAIERKLLPGFLRPVGEELHEFTRMLLSKALVAPPNSTVVMLLRRLLSSYGKQCPPFEMCVTDILHIRMVHPASSQRESSAQDHQCLRPSPW